MSSRRLSIQSKDSVIHGTGQWKDPGLMVSHMGFVYSKEKATGASEHSRMDNYIEDRAGGRILKMERERHSNPCAMVTQLVSRDRIVVTSTHAL